MSNPKNNQKGFAAFFITILILAVIFGIAISLTVLTLGQQRISGNVIKSSQSYFAAEAGLEDILLRLAKNLNWQSSYTLSIDDGSATIEVSDIIGGSRTITSKGDFFNRIRKIQIVYQVSTESISFHYGAQVGDGGIEMQDTSKIQGNVFSNGNVINLSGNPEITGIVKVAKTGNKLEGMIVGEDAYVDICENSNIVDTLISTTNNGCTAGNYETLTEEIATISLPITEEQITKWKDEAASGGVISGDYTLSGTQEASLGPKKIEGNMTIQNRAKLFVTGTLWVTGEITIQDRSRVVLDEDSYSSNSGIIIADERITVQDQSRVSGTGQEGSYLMLLSTLDSVATGDVAIVVQNSPELDIIYASRGRIQLQDSIKVREVCGWGLKLQNAATVIYEAGLEDTSFTSGPGGSWKVTSWREIE